jgi:drug/metabolite transporter (DMT)-like permease
MGQVNNLPEDTGSVDPKDPEMILKTVAQDLHNLQQDVVVQLNQDIKRLQAEKSRLISDVEKLQAQQRSLQQQQQTVLTQRQVAQQQLWAKQLAQALATQLQTLLMERISQPTDLTYPEPNRLNPTAPYDSEHLVQMLSSLDATMNHTLTSVGQDLSSYQSSLAQQISRMHNLEQQGEAILEALVGRLNQQLQIEVGRAQNLGAGAQNSGGQNPGSQKPGQGNSQTPPVSPCQPPYSSPSSSQSLSSSQSQYSSQLPSQKPSVPLTPLSTTPPVIRVFSQKQRFQTGLLLVLLSTIALSLHNIVVGIIGNISQVFGFYAVGGFIHLNNPGNSLLILWMRMLVVLPILILLASSLYKNTWRDLRSVLKSNDAEVRNRFFSAIGSGFFLFLSQVLVYIAIGQVGPGVAVTILFMYPLVAVLLSWWLFRDRPTSLRVLVMATILSGVVLTAFPKLAATTNISWLGIGTAIASGVAFACYLISMQISFSKISAPIGFIRLHPVLASLIQFATIFTLTSLSLIVIPSQIGVSVQPEGREGLMIGGLVLGTLTLIGYLLNNYAVSLMGAVETSIVAASGPVLTALLAFLITPGTRTALQGVQVFGILLVTLGVITWNFEKMQTQRRMAGAAKLAAKG